MTTRLAPWQRNMIALARGITLAPSGQMKWIANITAFTVTPNAGSHYSLFPIEADNEYEAARTAALQVSKMLFQQGNLTEADLALPSPGQRFVTQKQLKEATTGFINQVDEHLFRLSVGYKGRGRILEILIREYRGVQ